jgi:hypothetical protein
MWDDDPLAVMFMTERLSNSDLRAAAGWQSAMDLVLTPLLTASTILL